MVCKPEAPVDPLTHYPIPFVPDPNLPPMPRWGTIAYERYDRAITSFHHPNFKHWELEKMGLGGKAVRDSRVQWTWTLWHDLFHEEWGGLGNHMPRTEKTQCRQTLLGVMEYIPRQAIDFSGESPRLITLTRWQPELLRSQMDIGRDGERIRRFLFDYSITHGGPCVDDGVLENFLWLARRPDARQSRLWELAGVILNQSIDPIVTPGMREIYAYTKNRGLVRPGLPKALGSLVRREIISAFPGRDGFIRTLADRLMTLRSPSLAVA